MNPCVHTPGMPYLIICAISKFENHGSSPNRMGSKLGFCGAWPLYVYRNGTDSCSSCMIGGVHCRYQSSSARIVTCEKLMSRLLSCRTYLPQYGGPGIRACWLPLFTWCR